MHTCHTYLHAYIYLLARATAFPFVNAMGIAHDGNDRIYITDKHRVSYFTKDNDTVVTVAGSSGIFAYVYVNIVILIHIYSFMYTNICIFICVFTNKYVYAFLYVCYHVLEVYKYTYT